MLNPTTQERDLNDAVQIFASLMHSPRGNGSQLHTSCPNYNHSNALLIDALSGGGMDYTSDFETAMNDNVVSHRGPFELTSALTASTFYRMP